MRFGLFRSGADGTPEESPHSKMDVASLVQQMQDTLSEINKTVEGLTTEEQDARLDELEKKRDSLLADLRNNFEIEREELRNKRKAEREELKERRRKEDEEREVRRQQEDKEQEQNNSNEDTEKKKQLDDKFSVVEKETDQQMDEVEEEARKVIESGKNRLEELEGKRHEINRLIDEQLKLPLPPIPSRKRARGEKANGSAPKPTGSPSTVASNSKEETTTHGTDNDSEAVSPTDNGAVSLPDRFDGAARKDDADEGQNSENSKTEKSNTDSQKPPTEGQEDEPSAKTSADDSAPEPVDDTIQELPMQDAKPDTPLRIASGGTSNEEDQTSTRSLREGDNSMEADNQGDEVADTNQKNMKNTQREIEDSQSKDTLSSTAPPEEADTQIDNASVADDNHKSVRENNSQGDVTRDHVGAPIREDLADAVQDEHPDKQMQEPAPPSQDTGHKEHSKSTEYPSSPTYTKQDSNSSEKGDVDLDSEAYDKEASTKALLGRNPDLTDSQATLLDPTVRAHSDSDNLLTNSRGGASPVISESSQSDNLYYTPPTERQEGPVKRPTALTDASPLRSTETSTSGYMSLESESTTPNNVGTRSQYEEPVGNQTEPKHVGSEPNQHPHALADERPRKGGEPDNQVERQQGPIPTPSVKSPPGLDEGARSGKQGTPDSGADESGVPTPKPNAGDNQQQDYFLTTGHGSRRAPHSPLPVENETVHGEDILFDDETNASTPCELSDTPAQDIDERSDSDTITPDEVMSHVASKEEGASPGVNTPDEVPQLPSSDQDKDGSNTETPKAADEQLNQPEEPHPEQSQSEDAGNAAATPRKPSFSLPIREKDTSPKSSPSPTAPSGQPTRNNSGPRKKALSNASPEEPDTGAETTGKNQYVVHDPDPPKSPGEGKQAAAGTHHARSQSTPMSPGHSRSRSNSSVPVRLTFQKQKPHSRHASLSSPVDADKPELPAVQEQPPSTAAAPSPDAPRPLWSQIVLGQGSSAATPTATAAAASAAAKSGGRGGAGPTPRLWSGEAPRPKSAQKQQQQQRSNSAESRSTRPKLVARKRSSSVVQKPVAAAAAKRRCSTPWGGVEEGEEEIDVKSAWFRNAAGIRR